MKKLTIALLFGCLSLAITKPLLAQRPTTVKLATLVPDRSVWGQFLNKMRSDWGKVTDSRVKMTIFPNGTQGDDPSVVRKMRIGQLGAATLTLTGLSEIDDYFSVFAIPLYFDSYEEYFYVLDQLQPVLEKRLRDKGFVFIHWGHGGWIHLFSTVPVKTIDDLRKRKLFVWAGDDKLVSWYQRNGFKPVPLAITDVPMGLQTGQIDAMPSTPLAALALQWFRNTPYMLDMGFAPFLGATVVTERAWNKLSQADQEAILKVSRASAKFFSTEIPVEDAEAVTQMEKRGLTVVAVDDAATLAEWNAATEEFATAMRQSIVPPEVFDLAQKARADFRRRSQSPTSN